MISSKFPMLSVVVPCFNEELVIAASLERLLQVLADVDYSWEILVVNDGSEDRTLEICKTWRGKYEEIRILNLSRNFGHMAAITAGFLEAKGDAVVSIDADLQDPPELIPKMVQIWLATECEVVQGIRSDRSSDTFFKRTSARIFYQAVRKLSGVEIVKDSGDFRLINRRVLDILNNLPEKNKIYRLLIPWLGVETEYLEYKRGTRFAGQTKYPFHKMFNLAIDSFLSFSSKPLRVLSQISFALTLILFILSLSVFIIHFVVQTIPGWSSIVLLILATNTAILGSIALIGEYISKIYQISLGRPVVVYQEIDS